MERSDKEKLWNQVPAAVPPIMKPIKCKSVKETNVVGLTHLEICIISTSNLMNSLIVVINAISKPHRFHNPLMRIGAYLYFVEAICVMYGLGSPHKIILRELFHKL